jgi:hypothetical protein
MVAGHMAEFHSNTILGWIRRCFLSVTFSITYKVPLLLAHMKFGSWLHPLQPRNVDLSDILNACFWHAKSIFISHYLRDFSEVEVDF